MDIVNIIVGLFSALVGTYFGVYFLDKRKESNMVKIRKVAVKGLEIFKTYSKNNGTFDLAIPEFNAKLTIAEKRTIIVALHKIGIPVTTTISGLFDIKSVQFLPIVIDKEVIDDSIVQINSGQCDHLFFEDPDKYFTDNIRTITLRNIAKRFVKDVYAKSVCDKTLQKIKYPQEEWDAISWGEKKAIAVFRDQLNVDLYFNSDGKSNEEKIDKLLSEIELGVWDIYLNWTYESYNNMNQATNLNSQLMLLSQNGMLGNKNQ